MQPPNSRAQPLLSDEALALLTDAGSLVNYVNDTAASSKRLDFTQQTTKLWILNDLPLLATPGAQPEPEPEPEAGHSVHIRRVPMLWLRHGVLKRNAASVLTLDDGDGGVREVHVREVRRHPGHAAPRCLCRAPPSACRRDVRGRCAAGQGEFLETEVVPLQLGERPAQLTINATRRKSLGAPHLSS